MTNIPTLVSTFLCKALRPLASSIAVVPLLVACGGGGGGGDSPSPTPTPVSTVTSASAGSPVYGQTLLLTVNGTNLDLALTVTSAGCTSITRSTTAPNISTATTAYFTCTVAGYGPQQFSIAQTGAATALATAAYTVPAPQVSASTAAATGFGQSVLLTLTGSGLDVPLTVASTGCTGITRSTSAPNISTATTAYYTCTASGYGSQQFAVSRAGDNQALGTATYVVPAQVTAATTGSPVYGQSLLLTLNGAGLDVPLTVSSPGCTSITRSTTAPNISTANTAYYTCTVASYGAQQFTVTQTGVASPLRTAAYTVPAPQVTTSSASVAAFGQPVLLTLNGSGLDLPLSVSSAGCTGITRSTTAPNISSATTAYYTCTASVAGAQQFAVTRAGDNLSLSTASYTVPQPVPSVASAAAGTARYSQQLLLTLTGSNLDQPITVSSSGCSNISRSTTAPNISTATTAYYTCTVNAIGAQQFSVVRTADSGNLATASYNVPVPQVTMAVSNGAAVSGNIVITLTPQQTPVTVTNFLNYVNAGFYNNSVFHRRVTNFVLQGGGYDTPVVANAVPTHKVTNAPIVLEDNAGLSNLRLTVAMARTPSPDTATSEFFINLVDNLFLNRNGATRGYAVFGNITAGADVVTAMSTAPCTTSNLISECLPIPNLVITSATQTQ